MGKIKDIFHGEHKVFAWFVAITFSIFVLAWIFGPGTSIIDLIKAERQIHYHKKLIKEYVLKNEELDRRLRMIESNKDSLEKYARETYRFAAPGEDVYEIIDR
ncbi:MAG: septum formation initiator family protein [Bacteroidales bacterium]|nr:septum formation initiator family protein [Bacteroidales bacterium]MDD5892167.1 septum formation initiator family protein [Bacteroidales bacterium]